MSDTTTALTARSHLLFWTLAIGVFLGFIWLFGDVLLPFVLGLAIAYLLDPLVEFLGRHKLPRWIAALSILALFIAFLATVLLLVLPPLYREIAKLANDMPDYIDHLSGMLQPYINWTQDHFGNGDLTNYRETLQKNIGNAMKVGVGVLAGLATGGQALAGVLSTIVLTPVVAFFMMKEWKNMTAWIDGLMPRGSYDTIKDLQRRIDKKLAGFVRGQLTVAFVLGLIYSTALSIAGLEFGFLIGLMAGALSIIPLIGSTTGLLTSITVAWFQSHDLGYVAMIAAIFFVGQFVEGNFLTPRLLGKSVGLHPLWILFALLAGGSLFGIVGMLIAVPVAASSGVLVGFAVERYKQSPYYNDGKKSPAKGKKKSAASC